MTLAAETAEGEEIGSVVQLTCDTQFYDGQEVEADWGDDLTGGFCAELPLEAEVGLFVEVEVNAHDGKSTRGIASMYDIGATHRLLNVSYQYQSIVINGFFLINVGIGQ